MKRTFSTSTIMLFTSFATWISLAIAVHGMHVPESGHQQAEPAITDELLALERSKYSDDANRYFLLARNPKKYAYEDFELKEGEHFCPANALRTFFGGDTVIDGFLQVSRHVLMPFLYEDRDGGLVLKIVGRQFVNTGLVFFEQSEAPFEGVFDLDCQDLRNEGNIYLEFGGEKLVDTNGGANALAARFSARTFFNSGNIIILSKKHQVEADFTMMEGRGWVEEIADGLEVVTGLRNDGAVCIRNINFAMNGLLSGSGCVVAEENSVLDLTGVQLEEDFVKLYVSPGAGQVVVQLGALSAAGPTLEVYGLRRNAVLDFQRSISSWQYEIGRIVLTTEEGKTLAVRVGHGYNKRQFLVSKMGEVLYEGEPVGEVPEKCRCNFDPTEAIESVIGQEKLSTIPE